MVAAQRPQVLSDDLPSRINEAALRIISAIIGQLLPHVGPDFDHCVNTP